MSVKISAEEFVAYLVKSIVSNPQAVEVIGTTDDRGLFLSVKVAKSDMGLVIGKQGATVSSLRTLLRVFAANTESKLPIALKIVE